MVARLPREQVASERRIKDTLDILIQKYGVDMEQQKIICLDEFFRIERGKEETFKDYMNQFNVVSKMSSSWNGVHERGV